MSSLQAKALIFDWGDTIMRDFPEMAGPMFTWPEVELIADADLVLRILSTRYMMVIATNAGESDTEAMKLALNRVGVSDYFDYFFSSRDLGVSKPDPDFFLKISGHLGLAAAECIMIGNSYEKDIVGAKLCGMKTVLFDEFGRYHETPLADITIGKLSELILCLKRFSDK